MKLSPLLCGLTVLCLAIAVAIPAARQAAGPQATVEVAVLNADNWAEFVPDGKEVDAIYGDIVLRNGHLIAVIARPVEGRNANMTVRQVGGALIDFTTRNNAADQLSAFYPGKRNYRYADFRVLAGDRAEALAADQIPARGLTSGTITVAVTAQGTADKPRVITHYTLSAGQTFLAVKTTYVAGETALKVDLEDDLRLDGGKEDMVRSPNGTSDKFQACDRHWGQAYGLQPEPQAPLTGKMLVNSDARVSAFQYQTGPDSTSIMLAPGESKSFTRRLFAAGNSFQIHALMQAGGDHPLSAVELQLTDANQQPVPEALVEAVLPEGTSLSGRTDVSGKLLAFLPEGPQALRVTAFGRPLASDDLQLTVSGQRASHRLRFPGLEVGTVDALITDAAGQPIPCKVELLPTDNQPLNFGPETAEFAVRNLRYTPNGKFTQTLPVGAYDVRISHGPEYDLVETRITVVAQQTVELQGKLIRSVDTSGWISSDFHSHATPSGDNTSSQLGRVLNLAAEHIEFAPCTEHNRVDTYDPNIARLGVKNFLATVTGMELTGSTLPLNHQNAFPMKYTPRTQDGGGPVTADNLEDQIERLALWDDRSENCCR